MRITVVSCDWCHTDLTEYVEAHGDWQMWQASGRGDDGYTHVEACSLPCLLGALQHVAAEHQREGDKR